MSFGVTALVLLAAVMHASWNALIKASRDPALDTALLVGATAVICTPLLPLVPVPASASWPFMLASVLVHQIYFALVAQAYRHGDLSFAYPLMRGLPPVLVACAGSLLLPDATPPALWLGVIAVSIGVLWIGGFRQMLRRTQLRPALIAVAAAALIACYTLIDGMGVRRAGTPLGYVLWLTLLAALPYMVRIGLTQKTALVRHAKAHWRRALLAGSLSVGAYAIALWAMTKAPVAAVAALRETSVIFAALIGTAMLKEPFGRHRVTGACIVAGGIAIMKL
jgi:drug/metabolite transporter (DMT)-like permease